MTPFSRIVIQAVLVRGDRLRHTASKRFADRVGERMKAKHLQPNYSPGHHRQTSLMDAVADLYVCAHGTAFMGSYGSSFSDTILHLRTARGTPSKEDRHIIYRDQDWANPRVVRAAGYTRFEAAEERGQLRRTKTNREMTVGGRAASHPSSDLSHTDRKHKTTLTTLLFTQAAASRAYIRLSEPTPSFAICEHERLDHRAGVHRAAHRESKAAATITVLDQLEPTFVVTLSLMRARRLARAVRLLAAELVAIKRLA